VLDLTAHVLAAIDWHVSEGYGGPEFLFSKTDVFPRYIDSHVRALKLVQQKLGLRVLSHHKVGEAHVNVASTEVEDASGARTQMSEMSPPVPRAKRVRRGGA
jgi:hypothetical protein